MAADHMCIPQSLDELIQNWQSRDTDVWNRTPDDYLSYGREALKMGQPSLAFDILNQGRAVFTEHAQIQFQAALALARGGSTRSAREMLGPLLHKIQANDPLYSEVVSLAGRIAKDGWSKFPPGSMRETAALESAAHYTRAFEVTGDYFPGINAATMNRIAGRAKQAEQIARHVRQICRKAHKKSTQPDYWLLATLGEAALHLGMGSEAVDWYQQAVTAAGRNYGDVASMRRQLNILSEYLDAEAQLFSVLSVPRVAAFSGHMIDGSKRKTPRFPAALEPTVAREIEAMLNDLSVGFGYCSAACGGDILFVEALLKRGAEVHVVLPFQKKDFITTSVAFAGEQWISRFENVLNTATAVQYATEEGYLGDDVLFAYTGDLIQGMALNRGRQLETPPLLLALMEPGSPPLAGGTTATAAAWQSRGLPLEVIDIAALRSQSQWVSPVSACKEGAVKNATAEGKNPDEAGVKSKVQVARTVKAMLFADVVGFSKLGEEAAPSFFVGFLGEVAAVIAHNDPAPLFCNTWGDGLYIVMQDVVAAADLALRLRDMVLNTDWPAKGLPRETSIRIGLHAGPVYEAVDPVIDKRNYYGSHVNRAARIEPVTTPGAVFMSEQSASLLAASGNTAFASDYLGRMELAKKFGSGNLYRLRRVNEIE